MNHAAGFFFTTGTYCLLIQRNVGAGQWLIPAGLVKFDELVEATATRAAWNELGFLPRYAVSDIVQYHDGDFAFAILVATIPRAFALEPSRDVSAYRWFDETTLRQQTELHPSVWRVLGQPDLKLFAP